MTITGAKFAKHSDSATYRNHWDLRLCAPRHVFASAGEHHCAGSQDTRVMVLRRLNDMEKLGYIEHVGNAYRMTDKVNIPDLKQKLQKRIDMILATARELSNLNIAHSSLD